MMMMKEEERNEPLTLSFSRKEHIVHAGCSQSTMENEGISETMRLLRPVESFSFLRQEEEEEGTETECRTADPIQALQVQIALRLDLWMCGGNTFLSQYNQTFPRKQIGKKKKKTSSSAAAASPAIPFILQDIIQLLQQIALQLPPHVSFLHFLRTKSGITPVHLQGLGRYLPHIWEAFEIPNPFLDPPSESSSASGIAPPPFVRKRRRAKPLLQSNVTQPPPLLSTRPPLRTMVNTGWTALAKPANPFLKDKTTFVGSHFNFHFTQPLLFRPGAAYKGAATRIINSSISTNNRQHRSERVSGKALTQTEHRSTRPMAFSTGETLQTTEHPEVAREESLTEQSRSLVAEAMQALKRRRRGPSTAVL